MKGLKTPGPMSPAHLVKNRLSRVKKGDCYSSLIVWMYW